MSAFNIVRKETPINAVRKLAAPQLLLITFVFGSDDNTYPRELTIDDGSACKRKDCQRNEYEWFMEFARLKMEYYPESMLNQIIVAFDPRDIDLEE